jgi:preprotein translocase subunit SecE
VAERSSVRTDKRERTSPVTFYRQVVAELRKVVWPTQHQLVTYLIVVLVFVLAMIAYVSVLDLGFGRGVFWLFGRK